MNNSIKLILRILGLGLGLIIALISFVIFFAMAAGVYDGRMNFGAIGYLFHLDKLIFFLGFVLGGILVAFSPSDLWGCLKTVFVAAEPESDSDPLNKIHRKSATVFQCAMWLSILSGLIAALVQIMVLMMYNVGGDTLVVAEGLSEGVVPLVCGFTFAGLFTALKFRCQSLVCFD